MFKSGKGVSKYVTNLDGSEVPDEQIQTHGVELTIDKIFELDGYSVIQEGEYENANRREPQEAGDPTEKSPLHEDREYYALKPGAYVVRYNEKIKIPDGHFGMVFPRSRLIRNNLHLTTAIWESGYEGRGEGGLHVNSATFIEKGMRIGQMAIGRASVLEQYDGSHQGENLEE